MNMKRNSDIKNIYEKYSSRFFDKIASLSNYEKTYDRLLEYLKDNSSILDLACGPGNISKYLKDKYADPSITGIDFSERMLDLARKNIPDGKFIAGDVLDLEMKEEYDSVIFGFGLPYLNIDEFENLLYRIKESLVDNGIFYLSFMDGDRSGFEKTSFTGSDLLLTYYHPENAVRKLLSKHGFVITDEFVLDYKESDGSVTKDIVYISRRSI